MKPTRGVTLLELVIAAFLVALIAIVVYSVVSSTSSGYQASVSTGTIQTVGRQVLDEMARELRMADAASLTISPYNGSDRVMFRTPRSAIAGMVEWSPVAQFRWEPSPVDANNDGVNDEGRIVRVEGEQSLALCHGVAPGGLSISRQGDTVTLRLRLVAEDGRGRALATAVETSVTLRNSSD